MSSQFLKTDVSPSRLGHVVVASLSIGGVVLTTVCLAVAWLAFDDAFSGRANRDALIGESVAGSIDGFLDPPDPIPLKVKGYRDVPLNYERDPVTGHLVPVKAQ